MLPFYTNTPLSNGIQNISQEVAYQSDYTERYFTEEQRNARIIRQDCSQRRLSDHHSIFWTVNVLEDGWGDLFNCLNAVCLTKQEYPDWTMRVFITLNKGNTIPFNIDQYGLATEDCLVISRYGVCSKDQNPADKLKMEKERTLLMMKIGEKPKIQQEYTELEIGMPFHAKKIDEFINFSKTADLQISVSTLCMSLSKIDYTKFVYFREYGGPECRSVPSDNMMFMGVSPSSCGIYILQPNIPERFISPILQKYFNEKEKTYFNYGSDIKRYASLVSRLNPDANEINIVTNTSLETLRKMNLKMAETILFIDKGGLETILAETSSLEKIFRYMANSPEKVVRFINPFPLEHDDITRAIAISEEPVGITGNNTFSESLGRLPFYNNRNCLQPFWEQLILLAQQATPQNINLIDYLEQLSLWKKDNEVLIKTEDLPILKKQWEQLVAILSRDWNVKEAYLGEINRRISLNNEKRK